MSNDIFFRRFVNLPCSFPSSVLIININGETQTQEIVSLGGDCHGYWDTTTSQHLTFSLLFPSQCQWVAEKNLVATTSTATDNKWKLFIEFRLFIRISMKDLLQRRGRYHLTWNQREWQDVFFIKIILFVILQIFGYQYTTFISLASFLLGTIIWRQYATRETLWYWGGLTWGLRCVSQLTCLTPSVEPMAAYICINMEQ